MPEPAILHKCPNCGRVFDSPSVCEDGTQTEPFPQMVPKQFLRPPGARYCGRCGYEVDSGICTKCGYVDPTSRKHGDG